MRLLLLLLALTLTTQAQTCSQCAAWNLPQTPFQIYGNTYYVGPHGLSSILITSPRGHILIDGDLPASTPIIEANIRALGFRVEDIRLILNSHVHFDHAGGIASLQRDTARGNGVGARVLASPWSANVLRHGGVSPEDPQVGDLLPIPPVANVSTVRDGQTLHFGPLAITAHFTPGHTPGGVSWTWQSCEGGNCLNLVFADSITAISHDGYRFTDHPALIAGHQRSFHFLETTPCDILLTGHPEASDLWARKATGTFTDPGACRRLAQTGREGLAKRLAKESTSTP